MWRLTQARRLGTDCAMLAVLSPAKTLDYDRLIPAVAATPPAFADDATRLAGSAARMSKRKLAELMHISDALAALNAARFRGFGKQPERPAIYAFAGDVYIGFEAHSLEAETIDFAQDHVRILSGLYGLLRPLDTIRPYRLEMGTKWAPRRTSLYAYWGDRIADRLAADLGEDRVVVNLASQEYWRAVEGRMPGDVRVIAIDFREDGPKGLRFNSFGAKKARGMMARYLCKHRLDDPKALQSFDSDGYAFDPSASDDATWRFVRTI